MVTLARMELNVANKGKGYSAYMILRSITLANPIDRALAALRLQHVVPSQTLEMVPQSARCSRIPNIQIIVSLNIA